MHSGFTLSRFALFTAERPSLDQFVVLSLMLHVLAIVLFGDTTGGGARRGEKLWGALTVTVQGVLPERVVGLKLDRGSTLLQRPATETRPAPASPGTPSRNRDARASTPTESSQRVEEVAPPAQAPSFEMPPVISKDVEKAETDFVVPMPSADRAFVPPMPTPPAPPEQTPAAPTAPVPPPVIAPLTPVESKPREEPVAVPVPVSPPELPTPKIEHEVAKPLASVPEPKPREVVPVVVQPAAPAPTIPTASIAPVPPKPERENVPSVAPPAELKPREIAAPPPVAATAPSEPPPRAEIPKAPTIESEVVTPTAPPVAAAAAPPPTTTRAPTGTPAGSPSADKDLLKPRGEAAISSTDASALAPAPITGKAQGIDLDAVRRRARELSSGGAGPRTVFPFPGAPQPKPKSKEQQAFDKALKKNDCRDAYADMGLAAVVPLVLSAVREDGCKW